MLSEYRYEVNPANIRAADNNFKAFSVYRNIFTFTNTGRYIVYPYYISEDGSELLSDVNIAHVYEANQEITIYECSKYCRVVVQQCTKDREDPTSEFCLI
jgi:hypothetical protein